MVVVDIQNASEADSVPAENDIHCWVSSALAGQRDEAEVSVRIVDREEIQALNAQYRHQNKPTNVLSFPADLPESLGLSLLGDIVVCAPVVQMEAQAQGKTIQAHWAHMLIHGTLHLLGYDHEEENEAQRMEALETDIITALGFPPPYLTDNSDDIINTLKPPSK